MKSWKDKIRDAVKMILDAEPEESMQEEPIKDEEAPASEEPKAEEAKDDAEDPMAALCARVDALEAALAALKPVQDEAAPESDDKKDEPVADEAAPEPSEEEKKDEDEKVNDSAALLTEAQSIFARAEILSPGIALPIHDSKDLDAKKFRDSLCSLKRRSLEAAFADSNTRDAVMPLMAGVELDKLPCEALHATFVGASELVKRSNNTLTMTVRDAAAPVAADVNTANKTFWDAKKANPFGTQ